MREWLSSIGSLKSLADCLGDCSVTLLLGVEGSESDTGNAVLGGVKLVEEGLVGVDFLRVIGEGTSLAPVFELLRSRLANLVGCIAIVRLINSTRLKNHALGGHVPEVDFLAKVLVVRIVARLAEAVFSNV